MKKILITGSRSFLATHLVKKLKQEDFSLYLTTRQPGSKEMIVIDLLDYQELKKFITQLKPDIVIHLAALVNLSRDFVTGQKCIDNNIKSTLNLLETFRVHKPKLLIFSSTEELYGDSPLPYREAGLINPPSPYSISKLACEFFCKIYSEELNIKTVIFRIATMYGPEQTSKRFIPSIINNALKNRKILLNSGQKKRDYIYVEDVVEAIILTLKTDLQYLTEVINLGGGKAYQLTDVVERIKRISKSRSPVFLNKLNDRIGECDKWLMSISKAKKKLGWLPRTTLDVGLEKTISYFQKNEND